LDIRKEVDTAAEKAKTDPELPIEELYNHIIVDPPKDMKIRGCDPTVWSSTK
jgi:pyruvate dehydrogenase E1 component alpha subunit